MKARFSPATITALGLRGHILDRWEAWNEMAGQAQRITLAPHGMLSGGSDPRSDGAAIGY